MLDLLSAVIETSHLTLPMYGGCWISEKRPGVSVPGWGVEVTPFRDASLYWGGVWRRAGRPTTGWIHLQYTEARKQYHLAVLRVKRDRKKHQAEVLLGAAMEGDTQLLKEMKTIKRGGGAINSDLPDSVAGSEGEENIAEKFKEYYENLFNSAPSVEKMTELKSKLENLIGVAAHVEVAKVTGLVVKEAVTKMKPNKLGLSCAKL